MREQKVNDSDAGGTKPSLDNPEESRSDDDDGSQSSSSSSEEEDPELVELLRENSELSSSDDDKEKGHTPQKQAVQSNYRFVDAYDRPVNSIVVLVVACWTMRLPVMYKDFIE
jgi:RNA polymerase I-specific transcription initiation factor RRN7